MKIVIVGAGFAGIRAARELADNANFEVTLISNRTCFEYHAALYRSATGRSPLEVDVHLSEIFGGGSNVTVVEDFITKLNPKAKQVSGQSSSAYHYDVLLLALGAVTEYFGIKGLQEYSYGIKSLNEALELKNHLHEELSQGKADLNYVVVGGGPTGIELAGELVAYLKQIRRRHNAKQTRFNVDLVEAAPRVLPALPEKISRRVQKRLEQLGVKVYTSTAVKGETADSLQLPHGSIKTHTVIWTAGVGNNPFFKANESVFTLAKGNKVEVDDNLSAFPDIYVLGDSAATAQTGWAQTALYDAEFVTKNLKRQFKEEQPLKYDPPQPIGAIPVGPRWCAVSSARFQVFGYRGWLIRRYVDLKLMLGLLPTGLALKTWFYGNKQEESCPICRNQ